MAALLRSARLLKFSPSGLLQVPGSRRSGPPLGRLYSGVPVGRSAAVCSRQLGRVPDSVSRCAWPYTAGCVRSYAVATEQKDEAGLAVQSKQAQQFDWALTKLDSSVRRTGRITKTLLMRIFHDICRIGYPSGNHALLLLRSCGSLLPELPMEERNELAHRVWDKLQELGTQYDVSHYNALLKVYLQNEFKFSPTDFLAKMEAANVQPNRVTYQRLIAAYCQNGDIEGASTILGFMKSKDLPITEAVFSSLITGHSRAGDIESAANILSVMRGARVEPSPDTYVTLLNAYAEKGDLESMKKTLEAAESADCSLMDRDIMQVILTLAKAGQQQHIPEMIERLRHERGYIPDAMNLCLSLITQGHEDTAFSLLKTFPTLQSETSDSSNLGNFFLRHCVNRDMAVEKVAHYCKELQELNLHTSPFTFTLSCALEAKKLGMSLELMKMAKEQNLPVRPHYFWPLLTQPLKEKNAAGVVEVVKGMDRLGVAPDMDTLVTYILPVFPSLEATLQTLQDSGVSVDSEAFVYAKIRGLATSDLAKVYTLISDPSFPSLDLRGPATSFRGSLISGFKKSSDVDSMVKITQLLHTDNRFSSKNFNPSETSSYFLYNLIESISEEQVHVQEDKLRSFFSQLHAQNVTISPNIYRRIKNLLESYHCPELIKDVHALVSKERDSGSASWATGDENKVSELESKLAELKAENKPLSSVLKQTIHALSAEENLQRALELKQEHEGDMSVGAYAVLIGLCCRHNNAEEALNLKRELSRKDSSVTLDPIKYIALIKTLSLNDKVEEAMDILKEMKEKDIILNDTHLTAIFHMLNAVAAKGETTTVRRLQDTIFTLGLAKPTASLCSPLITFYLESKDPSGALDAVMECHKLYNQLPRIHDVIVALVEKGDTDVLQKVMDFISQKRGEMMMLYDLFFAFLQTGRYKEARKIIETPGLRAKPGRLQWFGEKCIVSNKMETLEQMVEMTSKLFECDRDEMYSYILRLCKETNEWQKAEATWTKMQEENVIPRERTLRLLADILKSNHQEVPFEVPETWYEQAASPPQQAESQSPPLEAESSGRYRNRLLMLCKKGKAREAMDIVKEVNEKGVALGGLSYDHVIRALLAQGHIEDALVVKQLAHAHLPEFKLSETASNLLIMSYSKRGKATEALETLQSMLELDHVPSHLAVIRLVQALGNQGDVAGIQEVETAVKTLGTNVYLSSMVFVNNTALAHIANGDVESAVDLLEGLYMSPDSSNPSMSFVFRKVMETGNDKALDKLSAMAERLANHFACYRPLSDLFLQQLHMDKVEDAKFLLARFNILAEQKEILLSFMTQAAQIPGQVRKIKNLLSLVPDFTDKETVYSYLMKCHALDKDLQSAKALYEQNQREGVVINDLFLKRLAVLYREAGETPPFPEPPESFKFYAEKLRKKDTAKE
ncbi:leucine-rich PPR motif-containing protein, mitochondrial [Poeciliopsis prolifica]|uniref:leucine-rich PPR motif-containing protein, mitochondrial n=1 Tax=Poeciliopsis prolifica TaxID=188132 RepID=UPI002413773F|nr:leucine-rich PPR motif-containing protein, mitochondrial [Poeciliopsis prolifica]